MSSGRPLDARYEALDPVQRALADLLVALVLDRLASADDQPAEDGNQPAADAKRADREIVNGWR